MKLTNIDGSTIEIPASSILLVREYPSGQTWVETNSSISAVIQCQESVEEVEKMRKEELK